MSSTDILVVGGGVVGLSLALELRRRHPDQSVTVLEKEAECGEHQSGRNSGVLHAGFYYTADSLKARLCRMGNAWWRGYCEERDLRINRCGKLVVARDEADLQGLDELQRRGAANGVELEMVTAEEAREIEPRARTEQRALWSPNTASVDPRECMAALVDDALRAGIEVQRGVRYLRRTDSGVLTSAGPVAVGYLVNAAGIHADRVAHDWGFGQQYTMLPFKGLYLYGSPDAPPLRTCVYPVPPLDYPFLGVHFTVTVDGHSKIGPTAVPAFWREHYGGLRNFNIGEFMRIVALEGSMLVHAGFPFRRLAVEEMRKIHRPYLVRQSAELLADVDERHYRTWGRPGIRAQLLDLRQRQLVMDFCVEGDDRSMHVLNAVSPAWTCAAPFASHVCDRIATATGRNSGTANGRNG